jgi:hypothetical protein
MGVPRGRTEISDFRDDKTLRVSNHLTPRRFIFRTSPENSNLGQRWETANHNLPPSGILRLQAEGDIKNVLEMWDGVDSLRSVRRLFK